MKKVIIMSLFLAFMSSTSYGMQQQPQAQQQPQLTCSICLENLTLQGLVITKCGHMFCSSCIFNLFLHNHNNPQQQICPLCRHPLSQGQTQDPAGAEQRIPLSLIQILEQLPLNRLLQQLQHRVAQPQRHIIRRIGSAICRGTKFGGRIGWHAFKLLPIYRGLNALKNILQALHYGTHGQFGTAGKKLFYAALNFCLAYSGLYGLDKLALLLKSYGWLPAQITNFYEYLGIKIGTLNFIPYLSPYIYDHLRACNIMSNNIENLISNFTECYKSSCKEKVIKSWFAMISKKLSNLSLKTLQEKALTMTKLIPHEILLEIAKMAF